MDNQQPTKQQTQVNYDIKVANSSEHLFSVNMDIELDKAVDSITLSLPAWIPGSYMIRDFAKHLHKLSSVDSSLNITQSSKQDWQISSQSAQQHFQVSYFIYAYDLSVRSAFINEQYAFFNGTSLFLCLKTYENASYQVCISDFEQLRPQVATGLTLNKTSTSKPYSYIANSYLDLIDHPFLLGEFEDYCFFVGEHKFHLIFTGNNNYDLPRLGHDLTPIIEHHFSLFGEFPCDEYWFITLVCQAGFGGLEHKNSTVLQYSRFDLPQIGESEEISASYQQFLSLCSHELFHTWHVKRIQPDVMKQPNLFEEVYSPQLWIYEGFTSLYDDLSLARTHTISPKQYVQVLSEALTRLYRTPGRHYQSLQSSSYEAWSKFYKQDAGSVNHIVSYYNKGAVVALCLDITLRQLSSNKVSLDHVMKKLWHQYGTSTFGTPNDVIERLCKEHFDIDISGFIHMSTNSTLELPLPSLLNYIGLTLHFRPMQSFNDKGGKVSKKYDIDVGALLTSKQGNLVVTSVQQDRAAANSGLQVGDRIVALNHYECSEKDFLDILAQGELGSTVPLHVMRDGRLIHLNMQISKATADTCEIVISDEAKFTQWLGLD